MNLLTPTAAAPWLNLVPVLLHTLWQGALIALLLGGALALLPACFARLRYGLAVSSLVAVLSAAFLTLAYLDHEVARPQSTAPVNSTEPKNRPAI